MGTELLYRELILLKASKPVFTEASFGVVFQTFNNGITDATVIKQQYKQIFSY